MPLINCEVKAIMTWSADCVIISTNVANQVLSWNEYLAKLELLSQIQT